MKQIVFATNNNHKLKEIRQILKDFKVLSLSEVDWEGEIPETQDTLEGNALQKAHFIYEKVHLPVFSDDTGLEVVALNGAPGVYSARYAGEQCSPEDNMKKLLRELDGKVDRYADFRTVIAFVDGKNEFIFDGKVEGEILNERRGMDGFGYDPIFKPEGLDLTFAEMDAYQKNKISHRGRAVRKFAEFLRNYSF